MYRKLQCPATFLPTIHGSCFHDPQAFVAVLILGKANFYLYGLLEPYRLSSFILLQLRDIPYMATMGSSQDRVSFLFHFPNNQHMLTRSLSETSMCLERERYVTNVTGQETQVSLTDIISKEAKIKKTKCAVRGSNPGRSLLYLPDTYVWLDIGKREC